MFKFSARQEWITTNPATQVEQLKVNRKKPEFLTSQDLRELIQTIDHPIGKAIAQTLAYTGLRIAECLSLTLEDVNFKKTSFM